MKKLLIFDLDGTLGDTLPTLTESMNSVLSEFSYPLVDDAHICRAIGNGMELMCRRCIPAEHYNNAEIYRPFLARYKEEYAKNYLNIDEPYAGLADAIAELKARGYAVASLSNKPHRYTVDIVEKLFGKGTFADIRGMIEGIPTKPDPTSFLDIASNLGFTAENTIMIGDSEPDINVANNAGANCIAVTWGYRTREQLEAAGAKMIIDKPCELLEILK
ncbi:MAG: HAD family hydrolase [Clostridia bacterium]|nr:HAD family hydrolase [Clostridia bacterium]